MKELNEIITQAYQLFSGNKPGNSLDACTFCCMKEEDARLLKTLPIKEIPVRLLREYQDAAKPEKLDLSELKYFAPRYLELVKDDEFPSFEPLLSFSRFGYIEDSAWTKKEKELLDSYAVFTFKNYICSKEGSLSISILDLLLLFYKGNFNLNNLLTEWEESTAEMNLIHFCDFLDALKINRLGLFKVTDAFLDEKFNVLISDWINSQHVKEIFKKKIEQVILEPSDSFSESDLRKLSWKYDLLD